MKVLARLGVHAVASLFLYYALGMGISHLLMQSRWLDMRFDVEYVVLVSMLTGLWSAFAALFMDASGFSWWRRRRPSLAVLGLSLGVVVVTSLPKGGLLIVPAYVSRKALFLEQALTLPQMNGWLLVWLLVGLAFLVMAWRVPLAFVKGAPMQWQSLTRWTRTGMLLMFGLIGLFILVYLGQGEFQAAVNHAAAVMAQADVEAFRDYLLSFGPLAAVVSSLLMVFQSVIAPLPAFVITFSNGLLFGWFWGAALSWSSAMAGAVLCFYLAKFFGRPLVEKLVSRTALAWADRFFAHYGSYAIFIARLVPVVSFDLVSYAAGLTNMRFWHFFWATGLGQLPATLLYSYLGQTATGTVKILFFLFTIVIALAVIGMLLKPRLQKIGAQEANGKAGAK